MMDFLNNLWVVSIGSSIISGIVVYFVTEKMFSRKKDKERRMNINIANSEIISGLTPYVVEKGLPAVDIINSMISAICRKYDVLDKEIYTLEQICQELIKDIIQNPYVSTNQKEQYLNVMQEYISKIKLEGSTKKSNNIEVNKNRESLFNGESLMLAGITTFVPVLIIGYIYDNTNDINLKNYLLIAQIIVMGLILFTTFLIIKISKEKRKRKYEMIINNVSSDKIYSKYIDLLK